MTAEKIIANNIIEARKSKGLTQEQLAEKVGVKRQSIGRIETCENPSNIKTLIRIASALKVSLSDLVKGV